MSKTSIKTATELANKKQCPSLTEQQTRQQPTPAEPHQPYGSYAGALVCQKMSQDFKEGYQMTTHRNYGLSRISMSMKI